MIAKRNPTKLKSNKFFWGRWWTLAQQPPSHISVKKLLMEQMIQKGKQVTHQQKPTKYGGNMVHK